MVSPKKVWVGTKGSEGLVECYNMTFSIAWIFLFVLPQIIKGHRSLLVLSTCVKGFGKGQCQTLHGFLYDVWEDEVPG